MKSRIQNYLERTQTALSRIDQNQINKLITLLRETRENGNWIYLCGNGGSALTASHFAGDLNKGASYGREKRFRAMCLSDNVSSLLAYANDVSYEEIFIEPLKNYLRPGDLVLGISGSGNSKNVIKAVSFARSKDNPTMALVGFNGGELLNTAEYAVHVNVSDMQIVEDVHMIILHCAAQALMAADSNSE